MLLESVASKTDHDQHMFNVFTHAHTIFSNTAKKKKEIMYKKEPEDQWSCIAQLSTKDMLKSDVIE